MKKMVSILLVLTLILSVLPVTAFAGAATKHKLYDVTYKNNELDSFKFSFYWTTATIYGGARLIMMTKELEGSQGSGLGDFSDYGNYGNSYKSYEEAKANTEFGFIYATEPEQIYSGKTKTMSISNLADEVDMVDGKLYYIYLWVQNGTYFYPDNLVCVLQMKNGKVKYSPAYVPEGKRENDYRNYYDKLVFLEADKLNVVAVPGAGMTAGSNASQTGLEANTAISTITVTANSGYYFPDSYKVSTANNIKVERISETTLQISGIPTADTVIHLPDATKMPNAHTCTPTDWDYDGNNHWKFACSDPGCPNGRNTTKTNEGIHNHNLVNNTKCECGHTIAAEHDCVKSGWLFDENNHWKRSCSDMNCPNNKYTVPTDRGAHSFTNDYDTDCNDGCGYTRTAPAEKPETGDITNIPLWTALFFGGIALLWVQLEQRKRQQF